MRRPALTVRGRRPRQTLSDRNLDAARAALRSGPPCALTRIGGWAPPPGARPPGVRPLRMPPASWGSPGSVSALSDADGVSAAAAGALLNPTPGTGATAAGAANGGAGESAPSSARSTPRTGVFTRFSRPPKQEKKEKKEKAVLSPELLEIGWEGR